MKDNIIFKHDDSGKIKKSIGVIIVIIFFSMLFLAFFTGDRNIRHYLQLKTEVLQLETDIRQLEEENAKLEEMIDLINKDPYYIEKMAREELKKARKDEIIIEFQDEKELKFEEKEPGNHHK
ncbi:MAG TPA: septum formation initiator family protein [Firmicutes bacterium]|nr:septum formation initiator family protein [Bacillota bacterium]